MTIPLASPLVDMNVDMDMVLDAGLDTNFLQGRPIIQNPVVDSNEVVIDDVADSGMTAGNIVDAGLNDVDMDGLIGSNLPSTAQAGPVLSPFSSPPTIDWNEYLRELESKDGIATFSFPSAGAAEEVCLQGKFPFRADDVTNTVQNPSILAHNPITTSLDNVEFFVNPSNVTNTDQLQFDPSELTLDGQAGRSIDNTNDFALPYQSMQYPQNVQEPASAAFSDKSKSSTGSNSKKSPEARCHNFTAEKPKYDRSHPWVRVNDTTKGKNNRSGKINQYNPTALYKVNAAPLKNWRNGTYRFKYSRDNELSEPTYSADQLAAYMYQFPTSQDRKLKLWIQRTPADSARRYNNPESSKCRFRECPARRMMNGSIMHGHFRVAFDERWHRYGVNVDPFAAVTGYVHLNCIERFLDFASICAILDVEVDERALQKEPRCRWAASLVATPEGSMASQFIKKCRSGQLAPEFANYPEHDGSIADKTLLKKAHERTLTCAMHNAKLQTMGPKRLQTQGETRKSKIYIHFGDVERFCIGRVGERRQQQQTSQDTSMQEIHGDGAGTISSRVHGNQDTNEAITSFNPSAMPIPSNNIVMVDAATQTDVSLLPESVVGQFPSSSYAPLTPFAPVASNTFSSPLTHPNSSTLQKRKRDGHRPEPISIDSQPALEFTSVKRAKSNDGDTVAVGTTRLVSYSDSEENVSNGQGAAPEAAAAADGEMPLSAMMREMLGQASTDREPGSAGSLGSLFG